MSGTRSRSARTTRRAIALAVGALVVVLLPIGAASGQGKPDKDPEDRGGGPAGTTIEFAIGDSEATPETTGSEGLTYVVKEAAFDLKVAFKDKRGEPEVLSQTEPTPVTLTYSYPGAVGPVTVGLENEPPAELAAGASEFIVPVTIDDPLTGVVFTASAETQQGTVVGSSAPFDVLIKSEPVTTAGPTSVGGDPNVPDGECSPTARLPVCGDLTPPVDGFAGTANKLSQGCLTNEECESARTFVQALTKFNDPDASETNSTPATLRMSCDKTSCGVGPIKKQRLFVTLAPNPDAPFGGEVEAPACEAKGVVTYDPDSDYGKDNRPFCVDYVQSNRDNAGDTHLYLLFVQDAKVRFS